MMNLLLLLGCPSAETDTSKIDDSGVDTADTADTADTDTNTEYSVAVSTTDYSAGALAMVGPDGTLTDSVLSIGSDIALRHEGDTLYILDRTSENTIRVYEDLDLTAPTLEFSTGDASNPHDIATCGGAYFVSLYNDGDVGVFSTSDGSRIGTVDLSEYADEDGSGEPDSMLVAPNGFLYVALNVYDYTYYSSYDGWLVKIDCSTKAVVADWQITTNPRLMPYPGSDSKFLIATGNYYDPITYEAVYDGYLYSFDTETDTQSFPLLAEQPQSLNIGSIAGTADAAVVIMDDGANWYPKCSVPNDSGWTLTAPTNFPAGSTFITAAEVSPDGLVWVAGSPGWGGETSTSGLWTIDPVTCSVVDTYTTALPAASIAVLH